MSLRSIVFTALCTALWLMSPAAHAHTPYLHAVGNVEKGGGLVSLEASFAEVFFIPEASFDNSRFDFIAPDGSHHAPDRVVSWKTRSLAETELSAQPGTWRFSTGPRLGARFRTWEVDGQQHSSRDEALQLPAGAKLTSDFRSLTRADTYLSVGAPNRTALAPGNAGLEIVCLTHPSDLYVREPFALRVLYDGKPLANKNVEIIQAVNDTGETPQKVTLTTDAQGQANFVPERASVWVAVVRHRTPAPPTADGAREYSNTYTLTFTTRSP